ncbi:hypothetical protein Ciccas_006040 [Cichlidogyrus casuarinus]|uniref:RIM zinc finger domain-containing protein n=1 Tax=Cichlidogyrus casuarinus TaxID=1844966 RepID=A0ABD2Q6Z5_9PLAT
MQSSAKMPPDKPDLSHLTPEERLIIEQVMSRQMQDEQTNSAVIATKQQLVFSCHTINSSSFTRPGERPIEKNQIQPTQANQVYRAAPISTTAHTSVSQTGTLNQVASLVKSSLVSTGILDPDMCEICRKVKFADGMGNICCKCHKRTCGRCGVRAPMPTNSQIQPNLNPQQQQQQQSSSWFCCPCVQTQPEVESMISAFNNALSNFDPSSEQICYNMQNPYQQLQPIDPRFDSLQQPSNALTDRPYQQEFMQYGMTDGLTPQAHHEYLPEYSGLVAYA